MSTYIPLGKKPESPEERQELLSKMVEKDEYASHLDLSNIQKNVIEFLLSQKGYTTDDLEVNREFKIDLSNTSFKVKADIVLNIDEKRFLAIKCTTGSIESWERYFIAFGRVAESYQIPFAVVTDGQNARFLDVARGKLVSEGINSIPSKAEAEQLIKKTVFVPYAPDRCDKEKMILYAFDAITTECS